MTYTKEQIKEAIYELRLERKVSPEDVVAIILYLETYSATFEKKKEEARLEFYRELEENR